MRDETCGCVNITFAHSAFALRRVHCNKTRVKPRDIRRPRRHRRRPSRVRILRAWVADEQTFIAKKSIVVREKSTGKGKRGRRGRESARGRARKIYTGDNISGRHILRRSEARWLIFGARTLPLCLSSSPFLVERRRGGGGGAKECLAFDLYLYSKSCGCTNIVWHRPDCSRTFRTVRLAHEDTFLVSFPKIQNRRGTALTIYAGISYAIFPGSVKGGLCSERYIIVRGAENLPVKYVNEESLRQRGIPGYALLAARRQSLVVHYTAAKYVAKKSHK